MVSQLLLVTHIVRMQIFLSMLIRLTGFHLNAFDMPRLAAGAKRTGDKAIIVKRTFLHLTRKSHATGADLIRQSQLPQSGVHRYLW